MPETITLAFTLLLDRAGRIGLTTFADLSGMESDTVIAGDVEATIRAVRAVLEEMLDMSVFAILANPELDYNIFDPDGGPTFSEFAKAEVFLSIPTSKAHRAALEAWARRPPSEEPALFELELRAGILGAAGLRG